MGILDGIVEWIAEQVMAGLDLVTTSVLGALGCDMAPDGSIAFNESIVKKLPPAPRRKDKI